MKLWSKIMSTPFSRHSKARRNRRRTFDFLTPPNLSRCEECGQPTLPHRICGNCGYYRPGKIKIKKGGRKVIDLHKKKIVG
jgi:large subunit ribosomal protein L32